ncbi:hypothetical protein Taro_042258 [Colocasia esculenta]|uniref:Uncharacterized protein n=1 Tax=Colocasia esculenta TaxID=4460 RepID=A0A843WHY7_COLES|nr:hypothetical protein [Colocasia esculenta]
MGSLDYSSNPFGSSDPWVATRISGSLAEVREVGSLQLVSESGSTEICNELITIVVPKKGVQLPYKVRMRAVGGLQLLLCRVLGECGRSGFSLDCYVLISAVAVLPQGLSCASGTLCVPVVRLVCVIFRSQCALVDRGLMSAVGVWLVVLLV